MKENLKQKKGFTIIELMAVLIIIAVLATLVITSVTSYKERARNEYINTLKNQMILAAKSYYSNNPKELPRGQVEELNGEKYKIYNDYVSASNLSQNNYFQNELVDTDGNSCEKDSYVIVNNKNGEYNYSPCLKCGDNIYIDENISETGECVFGNEEKVENTVPACSVFVKNSEKYGSFIKELKVQTNVDTIISKESLKTNENGLYIVNDPGTYEFIVKNSKGGEGSCFTTIFMEKDEQNPTCSVACHNASNSTSKCTYTIYDDGGLKKVVSNLGKLNLEYTCSDDGTDGRLTKLDSSIEIARNYTNQQITINVEDCSGKTLSVPCTAEIDKKQTYIPWPEGGGDTCIGSGCYDDDDEPDDEEDSIVDENGRCNSRECYSPGAEEVSGCTYYWCDDNCRLHSSTISGCKDEEEANPDTGCFLEGTKVLTKDGYKNIEDIEIGDYVLSYNIDNKKQVYNKVDYKFILNGNSDRLYEITVNDEIIKATEHHHFYIMENNVIKTKAAKDLKVGDYLIDKELGTNKISNVKGYSHFGTVYNLSVENDHNYYVYENAYLVHNQSAACKQDPKLPGCN